ncbi:MAG: IS1595 family transposase [Chloracidobacterium sp.]|nr:IS1595 family transposase [Chloracidobacterium sp.]MBK8468154.1 IS1595 family transposase [Chloracidobacterium sp.]
MKAAVKPKMKRYTVKDFRNQFPTDDACLEYLKDLLYPEGITCKKCEKITKHHKVASRRSYSCQICGHHVHPTAGTIYHKSTTPLTDWFYAVFLMASTRCGISAKQLERELGVTYKTAWRMFKQIRSMLDESDADKLTGKVEVDETYIGGKHIGTNIRGRNTKTKAVVAGAVERDGGKVKTKVIPEVSAPTLLNFVCNSIETQSTVFTDEWKSYNKVKDHGYTHHRIYHGKRVYVQGENHTNTIEGFWSILKGGIKGVYRHTSRQHLQSYVNEYAFRYNRRNDETPMFLQFLGQVRKSVD